MAARNAVVWRPRSSPHVGPALEGAHARFANGRCFIVGQYHLIAVDDYNGTELWCRQVGGVAERIVLWPLGGVAYVQPPQRPGATLWSLAAGPLVNVALVPVLMGVAFMGRLLGWWEAYPDLLQLLRAVSFMILMILVFNLLPVYPLDGGQILRSLLWYPLGRARSLLA